MYRLYITIYDKKSQRSVTGVREPFKEYNDLRMLKNRVLSDIKVYMSDKGLSETDAWDFSIFKVTDGNEVEFGNKDILFLLNV